MTTRQDRTKSSAKRERTLKAQQEMAYFSYSILVRLEGKEYASWCPELDVASSGKTIEKACANLKDAIDCFIETYAEIGELGAKLKERGITLNSAERCPSLFLSEARIGVPAVA